MNPFQLAARLVSTNVKLVWIFSILPSHTVPAIGGVKSRKSGLSLATVVNK